MSALRVYRRAGLSLVEMMIVIAIIGVLLGMLLPGLQKAREAANRVQCQNNLYQLGRWCHSYLDAYEYFPAYGFWEDGTLYPEAQSPFSFVLRHAAGFRDGTNDASLLWCPSETDRRTSTDIESVPYSSQLLPTYSFDMEYYPGAGVQLWGSYKASWGRRSLGWLDVAMGEGRGVFSAIGGGLYGNGLELGDIRDGAGNTLMLGEGIGHNMAHWIANSASTHFPLNGWSMPSVAPEPSGEAGELLLEDSVAAPPPVIQPHRFGFGSRHLGGAYFAFCDGSVRLLENGLDPHVFKALTTPCGDDMPESWIWE